MEWARHGSTVSKATILKEASGAEPGCVLSMPLNLVTRQLRTWLYSQHTETRYFSDRVICASMFLCQRSVQGEKIGRVAQFSYFVSGANCGDSLMSMLATVVRLTLHACCKIQEICSRTMTSSNQPKTIRFSNFCTCHTNVANIIMAHFTPNMLVVTNSNNFANLTRTLHFSQ